MPGIDSSGRRQRLTISGGAAESKVEAPAERWTSLRLFWVARVSLPSRFVIEHLVVSFPSRTEPVAVLLERRAAPSNR
jgi:hypothetical protein